MNFLYDLGVSTIENALPLPLLTTAALMYSVPKSMANIWQCATIAIDKMVNMLSIIFIDGMSY